MGVNYLNYNERIKMLRKKKLEQTREKQEEIGAMNHDDWALILPPPEKRKKVETISTSGMPITDILLKDFKPEPNHPDGGFFGPVDCGRNFRKLMEVHPPYINPLSSLAGGYMVNFMSYRKQNWNPEFDYSHLHENQQKYRLATGIGASQHFCQDLSIGLKLGWRGILNKIKRFRQENRDREEFYQGLTDVALGVQDWISRTAIEAKKLAKTEKNTQLKENLIKMAEINKRLITEPPATFREACQWIAWYLITARMYNGSGSLGRLDVLLEPYYRRDIKNGVLTEKEAIFHLACLLLADTAYMQVGGPDETGKDVTNQVSFHILEAAHLLNIPTNIGVSVGKNINPDLLKRGVEIMFADKSGHPKFLGIDNTISGFVKNEKMTLKLARQRAYAGCHWFGIPGREYTLLDCVKINFAAVFEIAWQEMLNTDINKQGVDGLWDIFVNHLKIAVRTIASGLDFHLEHMHQVFPELVLDLCCHGPVEKGEDASHGGVEFYNLCVDGAGLATVADSFAALEERIEKEQRFTWEKLDCYLKNNWNTPGGEQARSLMKNIPRYGSGGSTADKYAARITAVFSKIVKEKPTPAGFNLVPGLFSWANTIPMGKELGPTPNGRYHGDPISHGANPDPGFREDGAVSAMAVAIAAVQPGYGNTAPMQVEFDPEIASEEEAVNNIISFIRTHFALGGTMINMNVMDKKKVLQAHKNPQDYPDLVVRVTGFSAYFSSLSEEFRQLVVDRILSK